MTVNKSKRYITGLEGLDAQQPDQLSSSGSLTFSALERMQRMKNGSALPSVSSNLLSEV